MSTMPIFVPHCHYVPYLQSLLHCNGENKNKNCYLLVKFQYSNSSITFSLNIIAFFLLHKHESSRTIRRYHRQNAHFIKPIANSSHEVNVNRSSSSCSVFEPKESLLKIRFNGWRYPHTKWVKWVDQLTPKYESVWKKAGIFEPIMSTKSRLMKNQDLVYGVSVGTHSV